MASFSEENFVKKLADLNNSQQSIQTLSLWLIHHRKHAKTVVDIWIKELKKARGAKKLTFLYLANDVIQNSKKKGPEFNRDFRSVLPDGFKDAHKDADEKMKGSMTRLVNVWAERMIFDKPFLEKLRNPSGHSSSSSKRSHTSDAKKSDTQSKTYKTKEEEKQSKKDDSERKAAEASKRAATAESSKKSAEAKKAAEQPAKKKKKVELSLREEIELEMQDGPGEPPTADELIKALTDLENSASSDAAVREKIAAYPPEVSDVALLDKLSDTGEADALAKTVDDACELLANYNGRLAEELLERKRVAKMLRNYIISQKDALNDSEKKLQEYRIRLEKVDVIHKELKSHVQSLPDLTLLPDVTGGLAPLPSAGDLFSTEKD